MIERADGSTQGGAIDAKLLKLQLRAGSLPRGESYVFDAKAAEFRVMTGKEKCLAELKSLIAEIKNPHTPMSHRDLLYRRLRLVESDLRTVHGVK